MASSRPLVLEISTAQDFIQYVLGHHAAPSTLVVCSSKEAFLSVVQSESSTHPNPEIRHKSLFGSPTLRLLSTSRTLKLAFCPDITHLRAYLATYSIVISKREEEPDKALRFPGAVPILAIFNPIQLHRPTSAFSVQGLNRTFAIAIEAAHHTGSRLILAECPEPVLTLDDQILNEEARHPASPWDEELSILNVTTKRLGEMSVGRTVKARTVAERLCIFETLPVYEKF